MKKLVFLLILAALVLTFCACSKQAVSCSDFVSLAKAQGYVVEQAEDAPEGGEGYVAFNDDQSFIVWFYETGKEVYAVNAYSSDVAEMNALSGSSTSKSINGFACSTKKTSDSFLISSYIGSTYMCGSTSAEHADAMKEFFKTLGYK